MASVHVRVEPMVRYRGDLDDEWEAVGEEFHIRVTEAIMEHDAQRLDDADGLLKEIERLNFENAKLREMLQDACLCLE